MDSICSSYAPEALPVYAVEGLSEIYKVHIERSVISERDQCHSVPLFNNISQPENVVDTASSSPESCLFLSKFKVSCWGWIIV